MGMATAKQALQEVAELKQLLQQRDDELASLKPKPTFDAACYLSSDEVRAQLREQLYSKKPPSARATLPCGPMRQPNSPAAVHAGTHPPAPQAAFDRSKLSL